MDVMLLTLFGYTDYIKFFKCSKHSTGTKNTTHAESN
jgi:hypothetical protein